VQSIVEGELEVNAIVARKRQVKTLHTNDFDKQTASLCAFRTVVCLLVF
jgi:hypothetical protein